MGLTIHYEWKIKADVAAARHMVVKFRDFALKLPFDEISDVYEQDSPDGKTAFRKYNDAFRRGDV
jgi:hypothetical protein